jgi:hypothetical protein
MMQSRTARLVMLVGTVAVAIVLFVVLSGGDDDNSGSTQTQTEQSGGTGAAGRSGVTGETGASGVTRPQSEPAAVITVRDAKPVGGVKRLEYTKGDRIRFEVRSDVSDEIHVHGYDLKKDIQAGGTVRFNFEADLEGVFEVELESRGEQIAELRVKPS